MDTTALITLCCVFMLLLLALDCLQTLVIVQDPRWRELNPIIEFGLEMEPHHQRTVVVVYFAVMAGLVLFAAWAGWFWALVIPLPVQAFCVWHNYHIGIPLKL